MEKLIEASGTYDEVLESLTRRTGWNEEAADAALNMLLENPELLESAETERGDDVHRRGASELLVGGNQYYISVSRSILPLILLTIPAFRFLIMGIDAKTVMEALISLAPALAGFLHSGGFDDTWVLLDEQNGEKCVLLEVLKNRRTSVTAAIIKRQMGQKCEKDYQCDHKRNGRCACTEDKVEGILDTLKDRHILRGGRAGYRYVE